MTMNQPDASKKRQAARCDAMEAWPVGLRMAADISNSSPFPMAVFAGQEFEFVGNDAFTALLGQQHAKVPRGAAAAFAPDLWAIIEPMLDAVGATGASTRHHDVPVLLPRSGTIQECYLTFSCRPVRAEDATAGGVLVSVMDTTERVIGERRLLTLERLTMAASAAGGVADPFQHFAQALAGNLQDLPLFALYLLDSTATGASLAFCGDCASHPHRLPPHIPLAAAGRIGSAHPVARAALTFEPGFHEVEALARGWPDAGSMLQPRRVLTLPFKLPGHSSVRGVLVAGMSPRRPLDNAYRLFMDLVLAHVVAAVAAIDAKAVPGHRHAAPVRMAEPVRSVLANALQAHQAHEWQLPRSAAGTPGGTRGSPASRPQVLMVDDNPELVAYITRLLRDDCDVLAAHDGVCGLEQAKAHRPDLVLVDVMMPGMDGFELLRAIRADAAIHTMSVIMLSAEASEEARLQALGAGADDYLVKPFRARELTARIHAHVKMVRIRHAAAEREGRLLSSQRELRTLYERLQAVREEERLALARRVHDQLGQILSAAKIDVKLLEDDISDQSAPVSREKMLTELRSARETIDKAIESVRDIATELRPPELEDQGLVGAIEWHALDFQRRTRIPCTVTVGEGMREPDSAIATELFRIYLEAMTNVLRHAGASRIRISLDSRGNGVLLRVLDDGVGISRASLRSANAIGIKGMHERAAIAKGRLLIGPLPTRGTLVAARAPLTLNDDEQSVKLTSYGWTGT